MADSGSDTETDDELFERVKASQSRPHLVQHQEDATHVTSAERDHVEATNHATPPPPVKTTDPDPDPDPASVAADAVAGQASTDVEHPAARKQAGFLSLILNSDDDEPPHFDLPPQSVVVVKSSPPQEPRRIEPTSAALSIDCSRTHAPVTAHSTVGVSIEKREPPAALHSHPPMTLPQHPPVPEPLTDHADHVAPSDGQFVSPFASLAAAYQPPPPPVYGAPPVSYVPGRAVAVPFAPPPVVRLPQPPAPQVPCFKCSRVLPPYGSAVPRSGFLACSCCQRFYAQVVAYPGLLFERFCSACAESLPPQAPLSTQVSAPVSAPARPPISAPSPAPTRPTTWGVQPKASLPRASFECGLCKETVEIVPPVGDDRMQCNCCAIMMSRKAFSKNQQSPDHPCRRCLSCVKTPNLPAKFKNMHRKHNPLDINNPRLTKRQRTLLALQDQDTTDSAAPSTVASARVDCSPEERHQMEVAVRNYKLAKRSIQRRRMANDLRGSTRLEYEVQLNDEEQKVESKMRRARSTNPELFDELAQDTKVKGASVAPWERDHDGKSLRQKKQKKKAPPPKPPAKTKTKAKPSVAPKAAKRKAAERSTPETNPPAKRTRVSPVKASLAGKTKSTVQEKKEKKVSPTAVSSTGDSSDASLPHAVATRARTRQAPKANVVIDLLDGDSD